MKRIEGKVFFNSILRYIIADYLSLYSNAIIKLQYVDQQSAFGSLLTLLYIVILTMIPMFFLGLLEQNLKNLDKPPFKTRISALYLGIRLDSISVASTSVFLLRRLCFAWTIYLSESTWLILPSLYIT